MDHSCPAPCDVSSVKKFARVVWFRKWYESIRAHASVILVSLRAVVRVSQHEKEGRIDDAQSLGCLCDDAGNNALEEESVLIIKDV